MPNTFIKIASVTVGAGGAASINFASIPATFTDLVVKASLRSNRALYFSDIAIEFNNSTTSYTHRRLFGSGSSVGSNTNIFTNGNANGQTSNTFSNFETYIPNYLSSTNKSWSLDHTAENNATEAYTTLAAGLWSDSSAITSIKLRDVSDGGVNNLLQYSTATLYGIKKD